MAGLYHLPDDIVRQKSLCPPGNGDALGIRDGWVESPGPASRSDGIVACAGRGGNRPCPPASVERARRAGG